MCQMCDVGTVADFIFPREKEDLHDWFHRVEEIEHMNLVLMHHTPADLVKIAESYELQGFTYHYERNILNVLILRDLIFVTYTDQFKKIMRWS